MGQAWSKKGAMGMFGDWSKRGKGVGFGDENSFSG
jgi:hypothetical protein